MTLFEILNFNRELLERLAGTGYKPDDYKYIDLYRGVRTNAPQR